MSTLLRLSRREFLTQSTVAAVGLAAGSAGAVAKSSLNANARVLGANDRINLAIIGVGGMGGGHLHQLVKMQQEPNAKVAVLAVCDCWEKRREGAKKHCGGEAYRDYRKLLERKDIDGVVIATPDHWHSKISIDALEAGKDVYCQKPMTLYWEQARDVHRAVERTGRVFQCGAQSTSDDRWWVAQKLIRDGLLGHLVWTQGGAYRNDPHGDWNWPIDPSANPTNVDWNMWLGWQWSRAPKRPWEPERFFRFRKFWDYSGGLATDLLYHSLSHLAIALGPEFPARVVATGGNYVFNQENDNREVPDSLFVTIDYPSGHTVVLPATQINQTGLPDTIRGQHATMTFEGAVIVKPEPPFMKEMEAKLASGKFAGGKLVKRTEEVHEHGKVKPLTREVLDHIEFAPGERPEHMQNFLDCMRTRQRPALDAGTAYKIEVAIALAVKSYREKKVMRFDPVRQSVL